ncbi:HNH endonuclease [Sphingomonas sp. OTU376]|uniref:HNH endonuclease n=1 Tax=Sphingomonas sp. OTU376 TaxID=3043863 RepID=UPI00313CFE6E
MTTLEELQPTEKGLIIDLVHAAGVDVSDWSNGKLGAAGAKTNPKYCYEWAFTEPGKTVVLNLWHVVLEEEADGRIVHRGNFREDAAVQTARGRYNPWGRRATKLDKALQQAKREGLAIRVILNAGIRRERGADKASQVNRRALDPEPWSLIAYDDETGAHLLARGASLARFVDQFSPLAEPEIRRRDQAGLIYVRDPLVREAALARAGGACEHCGEPGFLRADGTIYLETHHVIPLFERGPDTLANVICLCPNHHREAHSGANAANLRALFLAYLGTF